MIRCFAIAILLCTLPLLRLRSQTMTEILGRPTDASVTLSVLFDAHCEAYVEYGEVKGEYPGTTSAAAAQAGVPLEIVVGGLKANTRYYYRTRYRRSGDATFAAGDARTFHTQRERASTFRFTIQADAHLYDKKGVRRMMDITMRNHAADSADFMFDLGDTFGDDHTPDVTTDADMRQLHLDYRPVFGSVCHSSPLFLCLGNHEGENGYYLKQTPPNNIAVYGTRWRTFYYPNPVPDGFYTGNPEEEGNGIGRPQNYYAFRWGDALFVVLDAYRYGTTSAKPRGWDWTLGEAQYQWFRRTLEASDAKYKFVFAHHMLGETRGAATSVPLYEWGGYEGNKRVWGFSTNRPGWAKPIHQLMVDNGVTVFFQGHDHLYAKEQVDGLVYHEVPMPSDSTYEIGVLANADAYTDVTMRGAGHIRVTVAPDSVLVEFVRAWLPEDETGGSKNAEVAHAYTVMARGRSAVPHADPLSFRLARSRPNPAHTQAEISFQIGQPGHVSLVIYDIAGNRVRTLCDKILYPDEPEDFTFTWDGMSDAGVPAVSGVYYYELQAGDHREVQRLILAR